MLRKGREGAGVTLTIVTYFNYYISVFFFFLSFLDFLTGFKGGFPEICPLDTRSAHVEQNKAKTSSPQRANKSTNNCKLQLDYFDNTY